MGGNGHGKVMIGGGVMEKVAFKSGHKLGGRVHRPGLGDRCWGLGPGDGQE